VKESPSDPSYGRTNWRRFAVSVGVPLAVAAGLVVALEQGAIAASFQISGSDFKLSATQLRGTGFTQYAGTMDTASGANAPNGQKFEALSGIADAHITKLCQTVAAGPVVLRIDAGDGNNDDTTVHATQLQIAMSDLQGNAEFDHIQIGVADGSLSKDGFDKHGDVPAGFGQQADSVTINNLRQTAQYTSAGKFTLPGMKLHLYVGQDASNKECF
jgi:hypothetical protein